MRLGAKTRNICRSLQRLLKDNAGNIAPLLGIAAIPLFVSVGAAIDTIRAAREQTAFLAAVDSAALAIAADTRSDTTTLDASGKTTRIAELKTYAEKIIAANYVSSTGAANDITIDLAIDGANIDLTAHHTFPTAIMSIIGVNSLSLSANSIVQRARAGGVELTLVMDTTGSMGQNAAGGTATSSNPSKLAGAQTAARTLLSTIYGGDKTAFPNNKDIRISLVPFTAAVHLDTSASDFSLGWIDTARLNPLSTLNFTTTTTKKGVTTTTISNDNYAAWGGSWNGCVEARRAAGTAGLNYNESDVAPTATTPETLFPAFYNSDGGSTSSNCAVSKIVPMTFSRDAIETAINAMSANGSTLIPEGLAWGWRTMSPGEPFTKVASSGSLAAATISPYYDPHWHKVMVLMTDGDNSLSGFTNANGSTTAYSSYGYSNEPSITSGKNRFSLATGSTGVAQTQLDKNVLNICSNIKAQGIELYVTGFGTGISASSLANLQACATDAAHYTNAANNADLLKFFQQIGNDINNNSLYVSK
jgi:Flp pilus assembly protein TadG